MSKITQEQSLDPRVYAKNLNKPDIYNETRSHFAAVKTPEKTQMTEFGAESSGIGSRRKNNRRGQLLCKLRKSKVKQVKSEIEFKPSVVEVFESDTREQIKPEEIVESEILVIRTTPKVNPTA